jgi:hypothetical protein
MVIVRLSSSCRLPKGSPQGESSRWSPRQYAHAVGKRHVQSIESSYRFFWEAIEASKDVRPLVWFKAAKEHEVKKACKLGLLLVGFCKLRKPGEEIVSVCGRGHRQRGSESTWHRICCGWVIPIASNAQANGRCAGLGLRFPRHGQHSRFPATNAFDLQA